MWQYGNAVSQPFSDPRRSRFIRVGTTVSVGMVLFGLLIALLTYPSWQIAVATALVAATIPILWVAQGRRFAPGSARAAQHLVTAGLFVAALLLFAVAGWLLSMAPIA